MWLAFISTLIGASVAYWLGRFGSYAMGFKDGRKQGFDDACRLNVPCENRNEPPFCRPLLTPNDDAFSALRRSGNCP